MEVLKVSTKSNPNSVAGALAAVIKEKNVVETLAYVQGSLALKPNYIEEESQYEKPTTKRVQILKPSKKIYMGCWQQSYTENDGDGC